MKTKRFLLLLLLVAVAITAVACSAEIQYKGAFVTEIAVTDIFNTDGYIAGDTLDIEGAKLIVRYSDMTTKTIDLTADMLSGYDMSVPEIGKVITVTYEKVTTTFTVNVYELVYSSVALSQLPYRNTYVVGETVSSDGAYLNVRYEGGKSVSVKVTNKMLQDYDNTKVGPQNIYINFHEASNLYFTVTFEEKTVVDLEVLHDPNQNAVFLGKGQLLDLTGMRLRIFYDNGLAPAYGIDEKYSDYDRLIKDDIKIFIDDSSVKTVAARVAYSSVDYPTEVTYTFTGAPMVSIGEYVYPNKELASNELIENLTSKTYGKVVGIGNNSIKVSTIVEYNVTGPTVVVGQIVLNDEEIGRNAGRGVIALGGGGIVTAVENGIVRIQTLPVTAFNINVKGKSYQSMVIEKYPTTTKFSSSVNDIIQGDSLNLSSGTVRVEFDNGEWEYLPMDSSDIKVVNSDDDLLRNEIKDFSFTFIDNVKDLPAGRYELKYGMSHGYGDKVSVVVTVVDETGKSIYVQENRYVSLAAGMNYTVSITASYNDAGQMKVSECVYYLSTVGAGVRQSQLDITAAGRHKLIIYYGGIKTNCIDMYVTVIQRYAKELNIVTVTDNISNRTFRKGDTIPISTLQYTITYNNGDVSEPTGITMDMLAENSLLYCDTVTEEKVIQFRIPDSDVYSVPLICKVIPMPIVSVNFEAEPIDVFLRSRASSSNNVDLSGGVLRVYYENGKVDLVGRTGKTLNELRDNSSNRGAKIYLEYNADDIQDISVEDILNGSKHYEALLTYVDEDGAEGSIVLYYYIVSEDEAVSSIKVSLSPEYYKRNYVQCEDWDLSGVTFTVTYAKTLATSRAFPVTKDMIYDSTTDNLGRDIPVKIKYLGKTDTTTLKINVEPRTETGLEIDKTGKDRYFNTDLAPDLSGYKFLLNYNAGASAEVTGLTNFEGSRQSAGWWYEIYDTEGYLTQFRRIGAKIIRLYHTSAIEVDGIMTYSYVSVDIPVEVGENTTEIEKVVYENTSLGQWEYFGTKLPVLEIISAGWELYLNEFDTVTGAIQNKLLTVYFVDGTIGYVPISTDMVTNYNKADLTKGYRPVTITYKTYTASACVQVKDAVFTGIAVEKKPSTNFIVGSSITLEGGIIRIIFEVNEGDNVKSYLYKYLAMDDPNVTSRGFNSDIDPNVNSISQNIILNYRGRETTYSVTIYNKQSTTFKYQNTIFFYGNTKSATATPIQYIPEFTLPTSDEIMMWYVSSQYFVELEDLEEYLVKTHENRGDMMLIICDDGVQRYVNRNYLQARYPVEPLKKQYTRYIVMEVLGNDYYRKENYCLQKYTVIPKIIEVSIVPYTPSGYVLDYTDNDSANKNIPNAVMYLYTNLDSIVSGLDDIGVISSVELLSPNVKSFSIGVFVSNTFDSNNPDHIAIVDRIFNKVRDDVNDYLRITAIRADIDKKQKGINVGGYNGLTPKNVYYRIAGGETLTLNGILELLEGSPILANYDYGVGVYSMATGSLKHSEDHYTIDFSSSNYLVEAREITGYNCIDFWNDERNAFVVTSSDTENYLISMWIYHADNTSRQVEEEEYTYYTSADCNIDSQVEKPTEAGTYYVKVGGNGCFTKDGAEVDIIVTLIIE